MNPEATYAPSLGTVAATILGCAALAGATYVSPLALAMTIIVLSGVVGLNWMEILGLPPARGCRWTLVNCAILACFVALATGVGSWPAGIAAAVAATLIAHLVQQVLRTDGRPRLTESVSMFTLAVAIVSSGAALLPLGAAAQGFALVAVTMAGGAAAAVVDLLGRWSSLRFWLLPLGMAAAGAAAAAAAPDVGLQPGQAALLGISAGIVGHPLRLMLAQVPETSSAKGALTLGAAGALACGALPIVVARLVLFA